jgi:hypothetical protein
LLNLGTRYLDYGLTGGFFLFLGLAIFVGLDSTAAVSVLDVLQKTLRADETKGFETLLTGIFTSLFIVCVFAIGLLLDLVGSISPAWEAETFRQHLNRNKQWIRPLVGGYAEYLNDDVDRMLEAKRLFGFEQYKKMFNFKYQFRQLTNIAAVRRLEGILIAYLLITADAQRTKFVLDQFHTYRIARAVSMGFSF